jgi:hypothetical protein
MPVKKSSHERSGSFLTVLPGWYMLMFRRCTLLTTNPGLRSPKLLAYLACYSLYVLLLVCSVVTLLIWRVTILLMIATWIGASSVNGSIYAISMIVIGLGLFMLVIAAEPYLRNGVKRGQLMRRFVRVALPVAAAGLLGVLLGMLM